MNIATFISTLLAALHYALLPLFAAAADVRIRGGIVAGLLGALLPINHWMMTKRVFEYALSAFTVLAFCIGNLHCWTRCNFTGSWAPFAGIVGGAVVLTYAPFLITMVCLAFTGWCVVDRRERRKFLTFTLIQFSVVALTLAP